MKNNSFFKDHKTVKSLERFLQHENFSLRISLEMIKSHVCNGHKRVFSFSFDDDDFSLKKNIHTVV